MMPDRIKEYLKKRGQDPSKFGWTSKYGKNWIAIPVKDISSRTIFYKLRKDPADNSNNNKYMFWPQTSKASLFNVDNIKDNKNVLLCEGEFDCMLISSIAAGSIDNIIPVTSTSGVSTFRPEWVDYFKSIKRLYICFDNDNAGEKGLEQVILKLYGHDFEIKILSLPHGKDITDYFIDHGGTLEQLLATAEDVTINKRLGFICTDSYDISVIRSSLYRLGEEQDNWKIKLANCNNKYDKIIINSFLEDINGIIKKLLYRIKFITTGAEHKDDISKLRQIPILSVLDNNNIKYYPSGNQAYKFKLREERTPSAVAYTNDNHFYDYGSNKGGSVIDLVMEIDKCDVKTAISKLSTGIRS